MISETKKQQTIVFGGGCFWCTEAIFKMLRGVTKVTPGYAGGGDVVPNYEGVAMGKTNHAEVVEIVYDSSQIKFKDLFTVFFGSHDPTSLNRQGNDVGAEYRSAVFYTNDDQRDEINKFIDEINKSNTSGKPIVTEVLPLDKFFPAEGYHLDYFNRNRGNPYCELVINPKLEKVQKQFAELLKREALN